MGLLKRFLPQLIILLALCVISTVGIVTEKAITANNNNVLNRQTVIIDAGHGGFDGGAVAGDGTPEKDINLSIAKNLKGFLELFGFNVIMTRESDVSTESNKEIKNKKLSDLQNRLKLMSENSDAIFSLSAIISSALAFCQSISVLRLTTA